MADVLYNMPYEYKKNPIYHKCLDYHKHTATVEKNPTILRILDLKVKEQLYVAQKLH